MAAAASGGTPDRRRRCRQDRSSSRRCGLIIVAMVAACAYVRPGGVRCHLASLKRRCSAVKSSTSLDPLHDRQARAPIHTTAPRSIHSTELDMELRPRGGAPTWIRFDQSIDRIDIDPAPLAKTQKPSRAASQRSIDFLGVDCGVTQKQHDSVEASRASTDAVLPAPKGLDRPSKSII